MATQSGEPLSPWAKRYGVLYDDESTLEEGKLRHSGYHTGHPRLDPKFYAEPVLQAELENCAVFNHKNDIHKLFHIEHKQYGSFKGIRPWQYGPLMQYVRFSDRGLLPGGHWRPESKPYRQARHEELADISRLLDDDMITVDENNWFPFFRRDRWYDLHGQKQVPSGKTWSIDQPKLWAKLRVSVELADRKLFSTNINTLNSETSMHTMLFGTLIRWRDAGGMQPFPEPFPDAKVLLSYGLYKSFCDLYDLDCPIDHLAFVPSEDWMIVLSGLLQNQTWGFTDDPDDSGIHWPGYDGVITLGVNVIDSLSGDDITLAERCHLQYDLTRTIIHELMHAIGINRVKHTFPELDPDSPTEDITEPFIDFDGIAELGYAIEQRVFGGVPSTRGDSTAADYEKDFTGKYPLGSHHRSWPILSQTAGSSHLGYKIGHHPIFGTPQGVIISSLPALYTSKLLSRSFWEDPSIPQKSDNFFHRNQLFLGVTQYIPNHQLHWQEITIDRDKLLRGDWYQPARQIWLKSPVSRTNHFKQQLCSVFSSCFADFAEQQWAKVNILEAVSEFGREFRKGNEIRCGQISDQLAKSIPWSTDADTYRAALVPPSTEWIAHCIVAATPIRRTPVERTVIELCIVLQLHPSARAPMLPPIDIIPECGSELKGCNRSELFDPINTGNQPILVFDHIDIINVLRNAIRVVAEANARVSKPWLVEILRITGLLEKQRNEMKSADPIFHNGLWIPEWDFKIPDYEPDQFAIWDAAQKEWV
ncbi:hypothetical protein F4803DRAFT_572992 [Xylaria telfairii]|nr:hypothetical protein F4803DRAFT_572992 [Xylaria telfairii]